MLIRFLIAAFLASAASAQPSVFSQVDEMVRTLSEITGWQVKRTVPSEMLGQDKFRKMVESGVKKSESNKEIRAEEITLKMFGLVPQDFNLAKSEVDLVSEQAAAFYDYNKKRLFVLDSTQPGAEQKVALVHELGHALADQHHPLGKYLRKGNPDDDAATAREAVMEGQATWLTWAYVSKTSGGKAEVPPKMLEEVTKAASETSPDFPVFSNSPLYLRESLVFPYNQGMRFQDAIFHKLGKEAFDRVFDRAPESTQQIMHPDDYIAGQKPSTPDPPRLESLLGKPAGKFRTLTDGPVGEFDTQILLRQYISENDGIAAAAHWKGGWFRLYEHKELKYPVLSYAADWDSSESAREYFRLYQRVLRGKWKKMEISEKTEDQVKGTGDSGRFILRINGTLVSSVEGLR